MGWDRREGRYHRAAPPATSPLYAIYETAGGGRVALAALRPSTSRALLVEIGRPDLAERAQAQNARDEVAAALRDAFRSATAAEWIERLRRHDVEIGPVLDPREAFTDPQLVARGLVEETPIGGGETRPAVTTALRPTWGRSGRPLVAAPRPGQHSDEILRELGYQPAEIERLRDAGTL